MLVYQRVQLGDFAGKKRVVDQLHSPSQVDYAALEKQIDEEQRQYEAGAKSMLMFGKGNPLLMQDGAPQL